jgi:hypothetical protein
MSNKISKDAVQKSIAKLQDLAKSQLHHTPSNSEPGVWAGTSAEAQDEHEDDIKNGTDYAGVRKSLANKVRKSLALTPAEVAIAEGRNPLPLIGAKLAKSESLTSAEQWAMKSGFAGMNKSAGQPTDAVSAPGEDDSAEAVPESHAGEKEDEVMADAKKSLRSAIAASDELSKGLELSPFLAELAGALTAALDGVEARITKSFQAQLEGVKADLAKGQNDQTEFNKSLADAVVGIGKLTQAQQEVVAAAASAPARGPKSTIVAKSFAGQQPSDMTKSQIVEVMGDLVKSNKIPAMELIKYESTGHMSESARQAVQAHLAGTR